MENLSSSFLVGKLILMTTARLLIIFGVLVLVTPYLGLPYAWLKVILPALGVLILFFGLRLHRRVRTMPPSYDPSQGV